MIKTKGIVKRKYFTLADLLIVAAVLCVVILGSFRFFAPSEQSLVAVVKVRGEVTHEITLQKVDEPYELKVSGECSVVIGVFPDGVQFISSECPDHLCVNTGKLSSAGQSAVCLPGRVSLTLENAKDTDFVPDAIVG